MKPAHYAVVFILLLFCSIGLTAQPVPKDLVEHINYYQEKGDMAFEAEDYMEAVLNFEKVLEAVKKKYGPTDTLMAYYHHKLGFVYETVQNGQKTIQHYAQAAEIWKKRMGEDSEQYISVLGGIYSFSLQQMYLDDINWPLLLKLSELIREELGEESSEHAATINNLALLCSNNGNYEQSELLNKQALEIMEKVLGEEHPDYATSLNNLALLYQNMGKYEQSEPLNKQALEIRKKVLGEEHPDFAMSLNNLALLYQDMGNYEYAEPLLKHALEITKKVSGEAHPDYALSLNNLAGLYVDMAKYEHAEQLFKQILKILKKNKGEEHPDYATTLSNLAVLYNDMGKYEQSEPLFKQTIEIDKKIFGEEHPNYATSLNNIALLYQDMGKYEQSELFNKQALEIMKKILGEEHPDYATSLNNLALLYQNMGKYEQAEPLCKQALAIRKKVLGEEHPEFAATLNNLAVLYNDMGKYEQTEPLHKQALEIRKKVLGEEHPDYATSLNNLATLYKEIGKYEQSEPLFKQTIEIDKKIFGEEHPNYATSLNNIALLYQDMGKYEQSELFNKQALEIMKKILGEEHPDYATSLNNLASLYTEMGKYEQSETLLKQALEIRKKVLGEEHPDYAASLNNLATLYIMIGKYEQSELLNKQALEIMKKILGEEHPAYATSLSNLAGLYSDMGKYKLSESLYKKVLKIREKVLGEEHPDFATTLNNVVLLYMVMGKYEQSETLLKQALEIRKKVLGKEHHDYIQSLINLAGLYDLTQNYTAAYPLFTQAIQIHQNQITQNFTWLSEKDREQYFKTIGFNFEAFHSFAYKAHKNIPQMLSNDYDYTLFIKGLQLATSQQMRNRIAASAVTTLLGDYENWLGQRRFLGKLYEKTIEQRKTMGFNIDSLEEAANRAEADLARRSDVFAEATDTVRYTWQDVQKQLKDGEAAVEIVRFNWYNKDWTDTVYYALMVVTPQTKEHPDVVWLEYGKDLEGSHFKNYVGAMKRGENDFDSYLQYWKPLDSLLQGANKVYLSLDGIYHKINLETLITPEGKYLGDEKELHLVGSTKDLVKHRKAVTSTLSAVLLGNPAYSADSTTLAITAGQFKNPTTTDAYLPDNTRSATYYLKPLPGTQTEIDQIGAVLTQAGYSVKSYSGKEAAEEAVKSANSPRILHLATHGAFLEISDRPEELNRMQFLTDMDIKRAIENPLLRSQLYFSGAQETLSGRYPANATYDNGVLTAYEAVNLNLRGTELVVLSACETGLGEVRNGEGVFGLQRAFQVAGAQSVMMSLREVSDAATSLFMNTFYQNFLETGNKRQAFKAAQQTLRKTSDYKHPYYWGAFVLVGE
ncbi:MAG: tetratricopeptide repeat protein [Sphingobacteriales bacterium]|nr:MAG: tetratricopeptide repeat protein [Sphingobacteriales bacterium]